MHPIRRPPRRGFVINSPDMDAIAMRALFNNGALGGYWPADPAYAYEDSAGTIPASVNGVVGLLTNAVTGYPNAIQATTANKPYLRQTPVSGKYWYDSNTGTGALTATFSSSLGSACTIATVTPDGVTIAENQTVGTTYNICQPYNYNSDVLIINRALTAAEKALVTRVMQRSVPTLGSELITNGGFDTDTSSWTFEGTATNNSTPGLLIGKTGPNTNILVSQLVNVKSGMRYLLKGVVLGSVGSDSVSFYTGVNSNANNYGQTPFGLSTMIYGISSPTASTMYLNICGTGASKTLTVDSVSVREIF